MMNEYYLTRKLSINCIDSSIQVKQHLQWSYIVVSSRKPDRQHKSCVWVRHVKKRRRNFSWLTQLSYSHLITKPQTRWRRCHGNRFTKPQLEKLHSELQVEAGRQERNPLPLTAALLAGWAPWDGIQVCSLGVGSFSVLASMCFLVCVWDRW